jgi:hypothetical protein
LQAALKRVRSAEDKEKNGAKLAYRVFGAFLCICGIGMLIVSYQSAKPADGFVAPVGLIGFGFYLLATGSGKWNEPDERRRISHRRADPTQGLVRAQAKR